LSYNSKMCARARARVCVCVCLSMAVCVRARARSCQSFSRGVRMSRIRQL